MCDHPFHVNIGIRIGCIIFLEKIVSASNERPELGKWGLLIFNFIQKFAIHCDFPEDVLAKTLFCEECCRPCCSQQGTVSAFSSWSVLFLNYICGWYRKKNLGEKDDVRIDLNIILFSLYIFHIAIYKNCNCCRKIFFLESH